jgi:hypothetical protein
VRARGVTDLAEQQKQYTTAYKTAAMSGVHTLTASGSVAMVKDLAATFPAVQGIERVTTLLEEHFGRDNILNTEVKVVKQGVLVADSAYDSDSYYLQGIVAWHDHYGGPWYDTVAVRSGDPSQPIWYGRLHMLFMIEDVAYAVVRWFDIVKGSDRDPLVEAGCTYLKWAGTPQGDQWWQVIALDTVMRRVYIVPDFSKPKRNNEYEYWYVNVFKWDRTVPDKSGIDQHGMEAHDAVLSPQT